MFQPVSAEQFADMHVPRTENARLHCLPALKKLADTMLDCLPTAGPSDRRIMRERRRWVISHYLFLSPWATPSYPYVVGDLFCFFWVCISTSPRSFHVFICMLSACCFRSLSSDLSNLVFRIFLGARIVCVDLGLGSGALCIFTTKCITSFCHSLFMCMHCHCVKSMSS